MISKKNFTIFFKSSEEMNEIKDKSVTLFLSGSLYLGKSWEPYQELYKKIYLDNCFRVLKDDGFLVIQQTDAYVNTEVFLKSKYLLELLLPNYKLIDIKVWKRSKVNFYQLSFSYFFIFVRKENKCSRYKIANKDYLQGIWDYPQTKGGEFNSWNENLCRMLIASFTNENDIIIDPLTGTGMVLSIGTSMNRKCFGYEINEELKSIILKNYYNFNGGVDMYLD